MSEKAPGQYPLTPTEKAILDKQDRERIEEADRKLDELAQNMGYVPATFEELGLTPEEIKKITYNSLKDRKPGTKYYLAERKDGRKVKVIARSRSDGCYFAEFISPAHHGANHDFSLSEMQGNMKLHLELELKTKTPK